MADEKPVVVFDGECPFCIQQIERFKRLDSNNQLEYVPRQNPDIAIRFPILNQSNFDTGMRFVRTDGSVQVGADAVYEICKLLPAFRAVVWLYPLPIIKQISRAVYACISANRKRLARKCDSGCKIK